MALVFVIPEADFVTQMEGATTRRGDPVTITSEPAEIARYGRYLLMMSAAVFQPIAAFALAGVLALIFTVLAGGRAGYAQYLAITAHALLIIAAGRVLSLPFVVARDDPGFAFSLALLAPFMTEGRALAIILRGIEIFTLWALAFCALGVSIVNPRRSWASAGVILVGGYVALLAAIVVFTS